MAAATLPAWATGSGTIPQTKPQMKPQAKQEVPQKAEKVIVVQKPKSEDVRMIVRDPASGARVKLDPVTGIEQTVVKAPAKERQVVVKEPEWRRDYTVSLKRRPDLPAEGEELLKGYDADRKALDEELEKKVAARRASLEKSLTDLQDKYTKAGRLDEAVAIRDFIKAGMPGLADPFARWINKK
jgi:hypothetical protein